ncbi:MAG: hypothetical protein KF699_07595 [Phycisphaeraceae bacterium]|nr:hypothetical protein [Phycisphaeraceae bacterium]
MTATNIDIADDVPTNQRIINVDWAMLARIFALNPESGPWQSRLDPQRNSNTGRVASQVLVRRVVAATVICAVLVAIGRVLWTHFGPIAAAPFLLVGVRGMCHIIFTRCGPIRREQPPPEDESDAGVSWDRVMHAVEHGKSRVLRIRYIHGAAIWVDVSAFVMCAVTMYLLSLGSTILPAASLLIGCGPWPLIIIVWLLVQTRAEWLLRIVRQRACTRACIRCGYALPPKPIDTTSSLALHCCSECGLHGLVKLHPDPHDSALSAQRHRGRTLHPG